DGVDALGGLGLRDAVRREVTHVRVEGGGGNRDRGGQARVRRRRPVDAETTDQQLILREPEDVVLLLDDRFRRTARGCGRAVERRRQRAELTRVRRHVPL